ncbi:MAG: 4-(cytidine 5'-diphospho)-2-C-methyl-D-erythritol kinase [Clostridia bacterium]|nr:4-(cytidine 5'-diphospho)-2-C-methyl-D-erythritol kinase [Clostridia bacterium]
MILDRAYAKINLTLDVLSKRPDGYHEIESLMQLVSLHDTVTLSPNSVGTLRQFSDSSLIPLDARNICYKAAMNFFDAFGITERGFDVTLEKHIPVSAGLGGGSADGAALIRLLANYFGITDRSALLDVAARTGSDVPFCLVGGSAVCRGRGEEMTDVLHFTRADLVIAKNCTGLSTPLIYSLFDSLEEKPSHSSLSVSLEALRRADAAMLAGSVFNVMEPVSLSQRPKIAELKEALLRAGALCALMSGSGPSVFGIFPDEKSAKDCVGVLRKQKIKAYYASFVNKRLI